MKQKPIRNYLDWEDLIKQSGYKTRTPKIGSFGVALIKASKDKNQGRLAGWVKKQLDSYFSKQKKYKKDKDERKK